MHRSLSGRSRAGQLKKTRLKPLSKVLVAVAILLATDLLVAVASGARPGLDLAYTSTAPSSSDGTGSNNMNGASSTSATPMSVSVNGILATPNSVVAIGTKVGLCRSGSNSCLNYTDPTGDVSFTDGGGGGAFSASSCHLIPFHEWVNRKTPFPLHFSVAYSYCNVDYMTPSTLGSVSFTASYSGDNLYSANSTTGGPLGVVHDSTTRVSESAGAAGPGDTVTFMVSVESSCDPSLTTCPPLKGNVSWADSGLYGIFNPNSCALGNQVALPHPGASCSADYTVSPAFISPAFTSLNTILIDASFKPTTLCCTYLSSLGQASLNFSRPPATNASSCNGTGVGAPEIMISQQSASGLTFMVDGEVIGGNITLFAIDWGDGGGTTAYFPQSHTYAVGGTYTVSVTVFDCTGGGKTQTVYLGAVVAPQSTSTTQSSTTQTIPTTRSSGPPTTTSGAPPTTSVTVSTSGTVSIPVGSSYVSQSVILGLAAAGAVLLSSIAIYLFRRRSPK